MSFLEQVRKAAEAVTGLGRLAPAALDHVVRARRPTMARFKDDGVIPNHPRWPLLVYRNAVALPKSVDPASVFEDLFARNGWDDSWRDGIYDYVHYHSRIHEVLGIARGRGRVRFGGSRGRIIAVEAGDVAVLPAGTGHQCLDASADFLVVGAYPASGTYDECSSIADRKAALKTIPKVRRPAKDPVYGNDRGLRLAWLDKRSR